MFTKIKKSIYQIKSNKIRDSVRLGIISDFHNSSNLNLIDAINDVDIILFPGDIVNKRNDVYENENALLLMKKASEVARCYYSLGNHENPQPCAFYEKINGFGVHLLNGSTFLDIDTGILFGGLVWEGQNGFNETIEQLSNSKHYSILLCHKPEMFQKYFYNRSIDLVVSGHTHGGQMKLFNRGIYSSGQGFFPYLVDGFYYEQRLIVSPGVCNTHKFIPRFGNPAKVIELRIQSI